MKKKQLETLEKINEERKLNKETKEYICKKALKNFLFATAILLLFIILMIIARNLEKQVATLIYKILSVCLLLSTLILFEVAYKKDSDSLAVTSIEMFFLTIITLLTPYILISKTNIYTSIVGVYFVVYYSIKNLKIYKAEKNKYINEKSDITQIIKKESQDELAKEQLEKMKQKEEIKTKKRKPSSAQKTKTKKDETEPKRKRGRPKKIVNS